MKEFNENDERRSDRRDSRRSNRRGAHGYGRRDSNKRNFGRSNRRSEPLTMHQAVCDECKKECEVPFKPTSGKPIYCSDCFKKKDKSKTNNSEQYEKGLVQINEKLDRILKVLEDKKENREEKEG